MSEQDAADADAVDENGDDRAGDGTDGSAENGVGEGEATDAGADSAGATGAEGGEADATDPEGDAEEDLVERLLDVRDNLVRALDQEEEGADAEDVRSGVETTLAQFDRVLEGENVDVVDPEPGEEVDPHTHEVLMRVDSDQPEGTIDAVHRPGYVMAEKVLQTAQVTVSGGDENGD